MSGVLVTGFEPFGGADSVERERPETIGGFVHLPEEMAAEQLARAGRIIVQACVPLRSSS